MSSPRPSARRRLLDATAALTYADGITATGVEGLVARAEVARMTLYRTFPGGKDELVAAVLRGLSTPTVEGLVSAARACAGGATAAPDAVLVGLFDALALAAAADGWRGCRYLRALGELPAAHPGVAPAIAHKVELRDRLAGLAAAGSRAPEEAEVLADRLVLLVDGVLATSLHRDGGRAAADARALAVLAVGQPELARAPESHAPP